MHGSRDKFWCVDLTQREVSEEVLGPRANDYIAGKGRGLHCLL